MRNTASPHDRHAPAAAGWTHLRRGDPAAAQGPLGVPSSWAGLGLAAWYAVLASVIVSTAGAAASLLARWPTTQKTVCAWWAFCVDLLGGELGAAGRILGWVAVAGLGVVAVSAARRLVAAFVRTTRLVRDHHDALTLIGRPDPSLGAVVVDDPRPAAYALPGRRHRIVITTGALT
jgi:Zn-dependent protease with chaperone function